MKRTHTPAPRLRLAVCLSVGLLVPVLCGGCAFIEAATEQTISSDQIPPIELLRSSNIEEDTAIRWPSVNELTGMSAEDIETLGEQGFPTDLSNLTFAHLQGALRLSGDCKLEQALDGLGDTAGAAAAPAPADPNAAPAMQGAIKVVSCTEDSCTDEPECEDFNGMSFAASVTMQLIDPEQAAEIAEQAAIVPSDAIVQVRFLVSRLKFFRDACESNAECDAGYECCEGAPGEGGTCKLSCDAQSCTSSAECGFDAQCCPPSGERTESVCAPEMATFKTDPADGKTLIDTTCDNFQGGASIHAWLDDFALKLGIDDDPKVLVIDHPYLDRISEDTPQRFDVEIESAFTKRLKSEIFGGEPVTITVSLEMKIAQENLYNVSFDKAGLEIKIQPEIVVSVIKIVEGQI